MKLFLMVFFSFVFVNLSLASNLSDFSPEAQDLIIEIQRLGFDIAEQ